MSTPYFTPRELNTKNTPWKGNSYNQMAMAFEKAFILTTVCAWCKQWMSGPKHNTPDRISHGLCPACRAEQMAMVEPCEAGRTRGG